MRRELIWSTSATFHYSTVRSNRLTELGCQKCHSILDILQPNVDRPDQFLAICASCGTWFRVETRVGDVRGVMVSLPEVVSLVPAEEIIPKHSGLTGGDR